MSVVLVEVATSFITFYRNLAIHSSLDRRFREAKKAQVPAAGAFSIIKSERRAYRLGGLILVLVQLHLHLGQFVRQHPLLISKRLELGQYLLGGFLFL